MKNKNAGVLFKNEEFQDGGSRPLNQVQGPPEPGALEAGSALTSAKGGPVWPPQTSSILTVGFASLSQLSAADTAPV